MTLPADSLTAAAGGTGPEDLLLVRRAVRGEAEAVEGVLTRLSCIPRFVYRINESLGYGLPVDAQEDVVQQVYMTLWPRLGDYAGSSALESWVYGFCRNCLRAEGRRRTTNVKTVSIVLEDLDRAQTATGEPEPLELAARYEGVDAVRDEIERLQPVEREVVQLRHLEGWSFEQIARHKGLPSSTIKDRCYRALMTLRGRLERRDVSA